jgi:hypothetical protein
MNQKTSGGVLEVSYKFQGFGLISRMMSADYRLRWCFGKTDSRGKSRLLGGHVMFGGSISRIQWTVVVVGTA